MVGSSRSELTKIRSSSTSSRSAPAFTPVHFPPPDGRGDEGRRYKHPERRRNTRLGTRERSDRVRIRRFLRRREGSRRRGRSAGRYRTPHYARSNPIPSERGSVSPPTFRIGGSEDGHLARANRSGDGFYRWNGNWRRIGAKNWASFPKTGRKIPSSSGLERSPGPPPVNRKYKRGEFSK